MLFRKQNRTVLGSQHVKKVKAINTKFSIFGFIEKNMELSCIHLAAGFTWLYVKYSELTTRGGQNWVHVVVECPLMVLTSRQH